MAKRDDLPVIPDVGGRCSRQGGVLAGEDSGEEVSGSGAEGVVLFVAESLVREVVQMLQLTGSYFARGKVDRRVGLIAHGCFDAVKR